MAIIQFFAGVGTNIANLSGSGLGLYGANGFGYSVAVGAYNGRTFITDSTGTSQGPEVDNNQFLNSSGVIYGQSGSGVNLLQLPNYLATLNIRFNHSNAVQVQNVKLYGYDRINKLNAPSGVSLYGAQIIHASQVQDFSGSGSPSWVLLSGSGGTLPLTSGPGISGLSPNGPFTYDVQHDWYVALTATPTSVGAKSFALWQDLEYL